MIYPWVPTHSKTKVVHGTYIQFHLTPQDPKRKTATWAVANGDYILGYVRWFAKWRKYAFYPRDDEQTIYEQACLRDIANFIENLTKEYKA
jgi:hypothetical protein